MNSKIALYLLVNFSSCIELLKDVKEPQANATEAWFRPIAIYIQTAICSVVLIFVFRMCVNFRTQDEESPLSNYEKSYQKKLISRNSPDNHSQYSSGSGFWKMPHAGGVTALAASKAHSF